MIVIVLCVVLVVVIATLAIGTRRQPPAAFRQPPETASAAAAYFRELGDTPPTPHPAAWEPVMAAPTRGAPPWNPAAGWAGGWAPDPETWQLHHQAATDHQGGRAWPASGNGPVTVAEPLAPLPPADWPAAPSASAPASARSAACTGPASAPATPAPPAADALTLLDERQQLIDHAAKVIAAAKFDRILGMAAADA